MINNQKIGYKMVIGETKFSICTCVKDRNNYLIQVLPGWLKLPAQEIIIVDWSSRQRVKEAIQGFKDDRIKIIRIKNEPTLELTKAINFAVSQTKEEFILKMDGDIIVKPKRFVRHRVWSNVFYVGGGGINDIRTFGTIWFTREMFLKSNGYNERMTGWGAEDNDFYERLITLKYNMARWSKRSVKHIEHPDSMRCPNNVLKNQEISQKEPWDSQDTFYQPEIEYIEKTI